MKKYILALAVLSFYACGNQSSTEAVNEEAEVVVETPPVTVYGDSIDAEGALEPEAFLAQMEGKDSLAVKVKAPINTTCRVKGCWMTLDMGNGEEMRVRFKDYGFFVPTEGVDGKVAVVDGFAFIDTLNVDYLKHLAEDEGKSEEEIAAITEPEISVNFEAKGVIIED
jgi:hypothetical protein